MILLQLLAASLLSLGAVESQPTNATRELSRNRTITDGNYTLAPRGETLDLTEDALRLLEEITEGRTGNETSDVIAEDEEDFQEQEVLSMFSGRTCQRERLEESIHHDCGQYFHQVMMFFHPEDRCVLKDIIGPYNAMTVCLEKLSYHFDCFYPNPQIQDFFIAMHSEYFRDCAEEEDEEDVMDEKILVTLILVPVSLIPILVYMVVRNSKVRE